MKRLRRRNDVVFEIENEYLIQKSYLNMKIIFMFLKIQHCEKS